MSASVGSSRADTFMIVEGGDRGRRISETVSNRGIASPSDKDALVKGLGGEKTRT